MPQLTAAQTLILYGNMPRPSEWVQTLWSNLHGQQLPLDINPATQTIQPLVILSANINKFSDWLQNGWQNLNIQQQPIQLAKKIQDKWAALVTRRMSEHTAQVIQLTMPPKKIHTASEFVHGFWHVFDVPIAKEAPAPTDAHVSILMRHRAFPKFISPILKWKPVAVLHHPSNDDRSVD